MIEKEWTHDKNPCKVIIRAHSGNPLKIGG